MWHSAIIFLETLVLAWIHDEWTVSQQITNSTAGDQEPENVRQSIQIKSNAYYSFYSPIKSEKNNSFQGLHWIHTPPAVTFHWINTFVDSCWIYLNSLTWNLVLYVNWVVFIFKFYIHTLFIMRSFHDTFKKHLILPFIQCSLWDTLLVSLDFNKNLN